MKSQFLSFFTLFLVALQTAQVFACATSYPYSVSDNSAPWVVAYGVISEDGTPCIIPDGANVEEYPCLDCLVPVVVADGVTYYLNDYDYDDLEVLGLQVGDLVKVEGKPSSAQGYHFLDVEYIAKVFYLPEGMKWTRRVVTDTDYRFIDERKVEGTEVIDGVTYQVIQTLEYDKVFIRCEGKKVFARLEDDYEFDEELLLYDFGLNIGDSIQKYYAPLYWEVPKTWHKVVVVDTVTLLNQVRARRLHYDDGDADIEYIGDAKGNLFRAFPFGWVLEAVITPLCCSIGDELLWEFEPNGCSESPSALDDISGSRNDVSGNRNDLIPTKRLTPDGILILPDGRRVTLLGTEVKE